MFEILVVVQLGRTFQTVYRIHRLIVVLTARVRIHPNPESGITLHKMLSFIHEMNRSCGTYGGT